MSTANVFVCINGMWNLQGHKIQYKPPKNCDI